MMEKILETFKADKWSENHQEFCEICEFYIIFWRLAKNGTNFSIVAQLVT
jgi:hypothetical protein